MTEAAEAIDVSELEEIERIAVELATLAGAEMLDRADQVIE
jgi:hypothetical protein